MECVSVFDAFLDDLAIVVTNLRLAFDSDIIIGGNLGGYMEAYRTEFVRRIQKYNSFDIDSTYIRIGSYKKRASTVGAAKLAIDRYLADYEYILYPANDENGAMG